MSPSPPEDGSIRIFQANGAQTQVLDDLGFAHGAIMADGRAGHFISMPRFHVYPTTFAAMNDTLDQLEQHF
ncbi:hypothetical protein EIO_0049 [Ketogulonicigenium vulgare Y25]|uniref:Uncharacterized protein n=1 Tax=Ketogulonicigenium vulgare (strain WSH-001) TaxID=759362 RepID=F9Y746_KETVW|nr:hypothetical protein [Ketogulonicigenium vulgare]ADO41240.1 hypothetical protein EIO_0049 [Ketogulonicigenium vulgare Y25]AEM42236.1 hypothetical protein KVU_2397 [Ketogulonicigenium vulgare WSH-001]ALJ79856.1 hypothetical protein KVH_00805 [Ketogulonicigenium vulgare]AOZ53069.1 hypothetical protein KVC_0042 [Ketogulonicigenium vulgare]